ncbi:MLO-like protein 13 [Acorus calamus]|uniref:MLO-like protein 13 n=1 Tax=Acorus calamus TaxID=4465 RepID=A0AAV9CW81_ACOCL|nr:MLO-like protein 13 [Acorus calamus]
MGDMEVLRESLEYTPTWVVATVCSVIVIISLLVERFLYYLGKAILLRWRKQESLFEALQKLKEGDTWTRRKLLSVGATSGYCKQGKVPLLSIAALHHLHIYIFVLAVVHVISCATTMILGGAQIRKWKHWEDSIRTNLGAPVNEDATPAHQNLQFANEHARRFWIKSTIVGCLDSSTGLFEGLLNLARSDSVRAGYISPCQYPVRV